MKYSQKQKPAIAFDEFQEVANYTEEGFEKQLRSIIQQHSRIWLSSQVASSPFWPTCFTPTNGSFIRWLKVCPYRKSRQNNPLPGFRTSSRKEMWICPRVSSRTLLHDLKTTPCTYRTFYFTSGKSPWQKGFLLKPSTGSKRTLSRRGVWNTPSYGRPRASIRRLPV